MTVPPRLDSEEVLRQHHLPVVVSVAKLPDCRLAPWLKLSLASIKAKLNLYVRALHGYRIVLINVTLERGYKGTIGDAQDGGKANLTDGKYKWRPLKYQILFLWNLE